MITKDYFEKQLKKHKKIKVYSQDNIPCEIFTTPYLYKEDSGIEFEMDCKDLEDYCDRMGLQLTPPTNN